MKILYAARLFSGLELSVRERRWLPTGVPTIYKLIEALSLQPNTLDLILCAKDGHTTWTDVRDLDVSIEGLCARVCVLASTPRPSGVLRRAGKALREARHALKIIRLARGLKPDVVYIDHGNIWTAGILARLVPTPVVLRVMGVYPAMRDALIGTRIAHRYLRWCYRAPYACVICTQDGSGVEPWLKAAITRDVPVHVLLNGVDEVGNTSEIDEDIARIGPKRVVVVFLGKLEDSKGFRQFVDGFVSAAAHVNELHALVIGTGVLAGYARERCSAAGIADRLTLKERLPHAGVLAALTRADIYVSLNRFGNLSNANLEAMRVGVAMVIPASQPETGVDIVTDELLPDTAISRITSSDDVAGLADTLCALAVDPGRRRRMADEVRSIAAKSIGDWQTRIDREVDLLRALTV